MKLSTSTNPSPGKRGRRTLVSALLYCVYLVVLLELVSRGLLSIEPIFSAIVGRQGDFSQRLKWVKRHSVQLGSSEFKFDVYDPTRGWAVMPNVRDMTVFDGRILNSNSRGIRGREEHEYARAEGQFRIVTLGDSYTFGEEVSDDETYAHYLDTLLPNTKVLNFGVHGYGHDHMLLYLKEEGVKYRPDVVIVGYVWFDMFRNLTNFGGYAKPKYEIDGRRLRLTNVPVPSPQAVLDSEIYRSKAFDLGFSLLERVRSKLGCDQEAAEDLALRMFDEIVTTARGIGAVPIFVYLPVLDEILNRDATMSSHEQFLLKYCQDRKVACLFLRPRFLEEQRKGATFNTRSHWFANAHMTAAVRIKEFLQENALTRPEAVHSREAEAPVALQ